MLHLGADTFYGDVQAQIDSVLALTLPGFTGAVSYQSADTDAYDWPLADQAAGRSIRCRVVPVGEAGAWWQLQAHVGIAVGDVGARVLWSERLDRPRKTRRLGKPDEHRDLLRLDLGVPGRATHTLVLYRRDAGRPDVMWGGDPATAAWEALQDRAGDPIVALVIDDWGYNRSATTTGLMELDIPLTMSVLPGLPYSRYFALASTDLALPPDWHVPVAGVGITVSQRRRQAGTPVTLGLGGASPRLAPKRREVMLHLPMQSQRYPEVDPGPDAIMVGADPARMAAVIDKALAALPNVRGVNNHQGSAATADQGTMVDLMAELRRRNLFFLDSLTTARSVGYESAVAAGLPAARSRVFLDHDHKDRDHIRERLQTLVRSARSTGFAVGIGHPHQTTLEVLRAELPRLRDEHVQFVTMSELLALMERARSEGL